jgi:flagellar basal-body rod modification protein FlgD
MSTTSATSSASAAIAQTKAATTGGSSSSSSDSQTGLNYNTFLKLLTAQLQNQDPLAPMDATQFMNQLAQLSTVEQSMKTNDTLGQVLDTLKSTGMRMDMAYIGRTVEASSNQLTLSGGTAQTAYTVDGKPATVKIEVQNSAGSTIYSADGSTQGGRQVFAWTDGTTAADGVYTVKVTAKDSSGNALNAATVISDTVKEVLTDNGTTKLVLKNGATVADTDVLSAS